MQSGTIIQKGSSTHNVTTVVGASQSNSCPTQYFILVALPILKVFPYHIGWQQFKIPVDLAASAREWSTATPLVVNSQHRTRWKASRRTELPMATSAGGCSLILYFRVSSARANLIRGCGYHVLSIVSRLAYIMGYQYT